MSEGREFRNKPLGDMVAVGAVGARSVRLWMRAERPGRLHVRWWPDDQAHDVAETSVAVPGDDARDHTCSIEITDALAPLRRYRFRVVHAADEHLLGEGCFETAPARPQDTPERFAIAVMSCHQPFDEQGHVRPSAEQMLRAARRCLAAHNVKQVFMVGDQIYADYPASLSLFQDRYFATVAPAGRGRLQDCSAEEVRRLYQRRYRHFWNLPEHQALQAHYPCYLMVDDHDIIDNWGSSPAHQDPEWRSVGEGALQASYDYQIARVRAADDTRPDSLHYVVPYGHTATFVMDLRSNRKAGADGQLFSDAQEADLRHFLHQHRDKQVLFIVASVPVVHLPKHLARFVAMLPPSDEDFSDRWSSGAHVRDRNRLLHMLCEHQQKYPDQRLVLLSGDIHIGCVHQVRWHSGSVLYQLISSPITYETSTLVRIASKLLIRCNRSMAVGRQGLRGKVHLLQGEGGMSRNPCGGLNLGLVEIETPEPQAPSKLRFYLYGHEGDEPVCRFRSALL